MLRHQVGGLGYEKPQSGYALCTVFSPPQFGQGSMLRIALLPAQTVIYSQDVRRQRATVQWKQTGKIELSIN